MRKIITLVRKEILDILRDKKTLIMMVLVPMLLYPTILIGMTLAMTAVMKSQEEVVHQIGISAEYSEVAEALNAIYIEEKEALDVELEIVTVSAKEQDAQEKRSTFDVWLDVVQVSDTETAHSDSDEMGTQLSVELQYTSTDAASDTAQWAVSELLERYQDTLVRKWLDQEGYPERVLHPIVWTSEDFATPSESFGMDLGGSLGLMLIVTILLGAMYPAIDATAGEKERGTLETLLTLPVTNFQMIMSKYISVAVFACTTAVISLLSLGGSVAFLIYGAAAPSGNEELFAFGGVIRMLPLLIALMITTALLISALCMCFCIFAKSFKEANNYIMPVTLAVMFASMAAMIPSIELDYRMALIPIVNVSLLIKQVLSMQTDMALAAATLLVNTGYSVLVIWVLAKLYDSEDILFSDGFRGFRLFQKRSEIRPGTVPAVGDVIVSVTVLLLLMIYLGSAVSVRNEIAGTVVTQLLILGVPLLVIWYMKSNWKTLLSVRQPRWSRLPGSILLYVGSYALMLFLSSVLVQLMPQSAQNLELTFGSFLDLPLAALIFVIAVMPAVGEELLFRGFLLGSFRERWSVRTAALVSAFLFGAFHMSLLKLLPTAVLGAAFAWILVKTGSIYVTMALHFVNNLLSVLAMKYPEQMGKLLPFLLKEESGLLEQILFLTVGAAAIAAGLLLLRGRSGETAGKAQ